LFAYLDGDMPIEQYFMNKELGLGKGMTPKSRVLLDPGNFKFFKQFAKNSEEYEVVLKRPWWFKELLLEK
jgi:hypothetical protein